MSYIPTEEDLSQYREKTIRPLPGTETSSIGASARAFGRAPFTLAESLGVPKEKLIYPEMLHEKPGDIQHPIAKFLGGLAFGGPVLKELGLVGKILRGASSLKDVSNMKHFENTALEAEKAHGGSDEAIKNLQDYFKEQHGSKNPNFANKIKEATEQRTQLEQQNPETTALAEQPKIDLSNRLPGGTGEDLIPSAQNEHQEYLEAGRKYLGHDEPNDVMFQNKMHQTIKQHKAQIGEGYNNLKEKFQNKNVTIPASENLQELQSSLRELVKKGDLTSPEAKDLAEQIHNIQGAHEIPASSLLTQFRTLDKLSKNAFDKSLETNKSLTEQQRENYKNLGDNYREHAEKISSLLESQVDKQYRQELSGLNSQWRQYASLNKNPLGKEIMSKRGISGSNIMQKMRGNDASQELLRNLTLSNPDALRAAIGHSYSENPESLLTAPKYEQQFLQQHEHLPEYMKHLRWSQNNMANAKKTTEQRQEEAQRVKKAYEEDVKIENKKEQARNKVSESQNKSGELTELIKTYHKHLGEYQELLKKHGNTLEQKLKSGQKLEDLKKISGRIKKISKNAGYVGLLAAGSGVEKKLFDILFK